MQVGSVFQVQARYSPEITAAAKIAGSGQHGEKVLPLSDSSVDISNAARLKLIAEQQAGKDMQADCLPVGIKHLLEKMVDDPAYGAEYANGYAKNIHTACMTLPEFLQAQSSLEVGQKQLQADWQAIQGQGKSPAQSYADLLKHELSLPQSYWDAQDAGHTMPNIRGFVEAKLAYLRQYMAKHH